VLVAVGWRVAAAWPEDSGRRTLAGAVGAAALLALGLWVAAGPLGPNWAARSGTPASILASVGASSTATASVDSAGAAKLPIPFSARLNGALSQRVAPSTGLAVLDIQTSLHGGAHGQLRIQIEGQAVGNGGVTMQDSQVTLGTQAQPALYRGRLIQLRGTRLAARVVGNDGTARLAVNLAIDQASQRVTGTATAESLSGPGATS
jgi:hypothetical protein